MIRALLLVLLFCSNAFAQIEWSRFDSFENNGGLNDRSSPVSIADNEASNIQNMVLTTSGSIKTRDGYAKLNASTLGSSVVTTGLVVYKQADGDKFLVGVFDDDKVRKMDYSVGGGPDGTWDDITGSLSFSVGQDNFASFAIGEDTLFFADGLGTNALYKYTGSGDAALLGGSPPNCALVAYHKRHAFCAGDTSNPSILYFSDLGDIENWTTGLSGNVAVETSDGSVIRAIKPGFDALYIWKDNSIWRLSGDDKDTFTLQRMVEGIGTLSTVSILGNDFFFTDGKGDTYIYDGSVSVKLISSKIEGTRDGLNFSRFDNIPSVIFDKDYYAAVSVVAGTTNNRVLVFDSFNLAWTKFKGLNINAMAVGDGGSGQDVIYFGDYSGFVYKFPSGTNDNGTAIDAFYTTKQYRWPNFPQRINKIYRVLNLIANQQGNYNISAELRADFASSGTTQTVNLSGSGSLYGSAIYGTDTWAGENLIIGRLEYDIEGQFFQLNFSNSNLDEPIEIKGWNSFVEASDSI